MFFHNVYLLHAVLFSHLLSILVVYSFMQVLIAVYFRWFLDYNRLDGSAWKFNVITQVTFANSLLWNHFDFP